MEASGVRGVKNQRLSKGAKLPIVKPKIRLPNDLSEKMPSAPCTPGTGRKGQTEPLMISTAQLDKKIEELEPQEEKPVVKSVASMVRRFELDVDNDAKSRAGSLQDVPINDKASSLSDSQDQETQQPTVGGISVDESKNIFDNQALARKKKSTLQSSTEMSMAAEIGKPKVIQGSRKITAQSQSSVVVHSRIKGSVSKRGPGQTQTSPIETSDLSKKSLQPLNSKLGNIPSKKISECAPDSQSTSRPKLNRNSGNNQETKSMQNEKKTSSVTKSADTRKSFIKRGTDEVGNKNTAVRENDKCAVTKEDKTLNTHTKTDSGSAEVRKLSRLKNVETKKLSRSVKPNGKTGGDTEKVQSTLGSSQSNLDKSKPLKSSIREKSTTKQHSSSQKVTSSIKKVTNHQPTIASDSCKETDTIGNSLVTAHCNNSDNEPTSINANSNSSVNNGNQLVTSPLKSDQSEVKLVYTLDEESLSEYSNRTGTQELPPKVFFDEIEPCDRVPVPSPNPSRPESPGVQSGHRHILNIDKSRQTDSFRLSAPQSNLLEHDLPESPAYRSPCLSDSETERDIEDISSKKHVLDVFDDQPSLRNKLLSNLVNKRSESDGIVTLDRPRPEAPVRRYESVDDISYDKEDAMIGSYSQSAEMLREEMFPNSIKTVTPATILKGPEDYTAGLQETVYLRAHYFGNPEPRVAWYKGGCRLNHADRIKIRTYPGESTLVIRDLRAEDSGKYELQIENEVGTDECAASLCVEGPPEPPGGRPFVTSVDRGSLKITLAWYGSTFDGGSMLTGYIVEMSSWPISNSGMEETSIVDPTTWTVVTAKCHSTSYILKNLDPDCEYVFRVRAQNMHGQSEPGKISEPANFVKIDSLFDDYDDESDDHAASDDEDFDSPFDHKKVELEDGSIFKNKFEIYEELGRGRFGVVFKVRERETREVFAAKFVRCRKKEERDKCKGEIAIMNGLDHSRLLQLNAAYENPREVIMIMEFIGGGELFEKVVADDFTLTEHDCVLFMRQICNAIGYMHQKNIVHLDLKPENILCKSKKSHQIKIIDFGLTRKLEPGGDVRILFGTPEFVSPEVISYEPVSASSDMWSIGVVCYVLLSGLSPFMGDSDVETFSNITGLCYDFDDDAFEHITEDAKDFIEKLLNKDQRKRLKAHECLKHPWLNQQNTDKKTWKEINTDKLKSFLMRRRWQKAAHAIRALGRFTSFGFRQDSRDEASSFSTLSTQSADF